MSLSILSKRLTSLRHAVCDQRGFSLLSTLLAVMILAVILSIAVPRFSSAIVTANTVKVQADLTALDTAIADLKEYVTDLDNLKPPSGNVRVGDKEEPLENAVYKIEQKDNVWRATCAGRTAEEYLTKR